MNSWSDDLVNDNKRISFEDECVNIVAIYMNENNLH